MATRAAIGGSAVQAHRGQCHAEEQLQEQSGIVRELKAEVGRLAAALAASQAERDTALQRAEVAARARMDAAVAEARQDGLRQGAADAAAAAAQQQAQHVVRAIAALVFVFVLMGGRRVLYRGRCSQGRVPRLTPRDSAVPRFQRSIVTAGYGQAAAQCRSFVFNAPVPATVCHRGFCIKIWHKRDATAHRCRLF